MTQRSGEKLRATLIAAVEQESHEAERTGREIRLGRGACISTEGSRTIYSFALKQKLNVKEEGACTLTVRGRRTAATIVSAAERALRLAVSEDLGSTIESAILKTDESSLLRQLATSLRELGEPENLQEWNSHLAEGALSGSVSNRGEAAVRLTVPDELTSDQKLALNVAGSQALMYLWGPPGTGKTVTLAALAWSLACSNRRVLIVSHTHRAVDGVLEGLCQRVSQQVPSALSSHAILRIGPIARSSLREKFGAEISFEQVLARNESTVVHQLSALKQEQTSIRKKAWEASKQLSLWDARERLQDELEVLKESLAESSLELKGVGGRILAADTRPSTADTAPDGDIRESISLLEKGLTEIERTFTAESREEIENLSAQLNNRQHELATAIATLERSLRVLRAEILSDARIVATTATQAFLRTKELVDFDTIILDEASMLPLPLVYRLCGMARRSVVIAGDFRQLPPISVSRSEIVAQWFARDVFEAAGIVDSVNLGKTQPHLVKLTTQFRSRDELCSLINHRFYGGDLSSRYTDREPMECPPAVAFLKDYPIVLVDSSDLAPVGHSVGRSKANLPHALLVRLLCSRLSKSASKQRDSLVGVIAPYRAQVELIEDLLQEAGITGIEVGTIHRFQGEERKIIILDLTESPPHSLGSFLSSTSLKDVGAKLLNVALSRAESNLLLVANVSFLRSKTRDTHILRGILDDVERVAFRLTTTELCTALEEQLVPTIHPRVSSERKASS